MPRSNSSVPKLTHNKTTERGVVRLSGRDFYCGRWPASHDQPPAETREKYDRLIAEWLANGRRPLNEPDTAGQGAAPVGPSVNELILAFWNFAKVHYRHDDGTPTGELDNYRLTFRPLRQMYGLTPAAGFGPKKLAAVREQMIATGMYAERDVGLAVRVAGETG